MGGGTYGKVYKGYDFEERRFIAVKNVPRRILNKTNGLEKR